MQKRRKRKEKVNNNNYYCKRARSRKINRKTRKIKKLRRVMVLCSRFRKKSRRVKNQ
jgi:hypothetical protein